MYTTSIYFYLILGDFLLFSVIISLTIIERVPHMNYFLDFLITFFLGYLGVHKFVQGNIKMGVLYLFTGGLFGIGWLIDIITSFVNLVRQILSYMKFYTRSTTPDYQLLEWQQMILPDSNQLIMSRKQLETATKDVLLQYASSIDDCQNVIQHTVDPKSFFYHYDLLLQKLSEVERLQNYMNLNYNVESYLNEYRLNKNKYFVDFVDRSWDHAIIKADAIPDENDQRELFTELFEEYREHNDYMTAEIIAYYEKKYYTRFPKER